MSTSSAIYRLAPPVTPRMPPQPPLWRPMALGAVALSVSHQPGETVAPSGIVHPTTNHRFVSATSGGHVMVGE